MSSLRRYEILVPLLFNDGRPVPEAVLTEAFTELRTKYGAASWETQMVHGLWETEGTVYRDNLTRFFVDVPQFARTSGIFQRVQGEIEAAF